MRAGLPHEIDGTVVTVNDNRVYAAAGIVGKAPRAAIAYKFAAEESTTVVEEIVVQIGRTGVLTPVARVRPVTVGGVTVTHATLHNADEIGRLGLMTGDTVIVSRAGDVIPKIIRVLPELRTGKETTFIMPIMCPVDGSPVVRDGVAYRCSNRDCGAVTRRSLAHFVSRIAFSIDGLGPKLLDKFLDEGLLHDAADIFTLQAGDIAVLPGLGEKSAANIIIEIAAKRTVSASRFIYALGILHTGEETARTVAGGFARSGRTITRPLELLTACEELTTDDWEAMPDIGPVVASSLRAWFHDARNTDLVRRLDGAGVRISQEIETPENARLAGTSFVLTGTLASLSRDEAKAKIRALGGTTAESVSKKTSYAVAGENAGTKLAAARKLGVPVLSEVDFLKLIISNGA